MSNTQYIIIAGILPRLNDADLEQVRLVTAALIAERAITKLLKLEIIYSSTTLIECGNCNQMRPRLHTATDPDVWTLTVPVACAECFRTAAAASAPIAGEVQ